LLTVLSTKYQLSDIITLCSTVLTLV